MASNADLTNAVDSGSYKTESDERLRELIEAAVNIHGANPIALHRIDHAAEILRREMTDRAAQRREKIEAARYVDIERRLDDLKHPHWPSVVPP